MPNSEDKAIELSPDSRSALLEAGWQPAIIKIPHGCHPDFKPLVGRHVRIMRVDDYSTWILKLRATGCDSEHPVMVHNDDVADYLRIVGATSLYLCEHEYVTD